MDEPNNLLACPFCGSPDVQIRKSTHREWVACRECGAETAWEERADGSNATRAWNRRAGGLAHGATDGSRLGAVSGWVPTARQAAQTIVRYFLRDWIAWTPENMVDEAEDIIQKAIDANHQAPNGGDEARAGGPLPPSTG